jgi:hypothetical protein
MTAALTIAAAAVMVSLAITAQASMHHAHASHPVAGITFNALD